MQNIFITCQSMDKCSVCKTQIGSLYICGGCKSVSYCGQECQVNDFAIHKKICSRVGRGVTQTSRFADESGINRTYLKKPDEIYMKEMPQKTLKQEQTKRPKTLEPEFDYSSFSGEKLIAKLEQEKILAEQLRKEGEKCIKDTFATLNLQFPETLDRESRKRDAKQYLSRAESLILENIEGYIQFGEHYSQAIYSNSKEHEQKTVESFKNYFDKEKEIDLIKKKLETISLTNNEAMEFEKQEKEKEIENNAILFASALNHSYLEISELDVVSSNELATSRRKVYEKIGIQVDKLKEQLKTITGVTCFDKEAEEMDKKEEYLFEDIEKMNNVEEMDSKLNQFQNIITLALESVAEAPRKLFLLIVQKLKEIIAAGRIKLDEFWKKDYLQRALTVFKYMAYAIIFAGLGFALYDYYYKRYGITNKMTRDLADLDENVSKSSGIIASLQEKLMFMTKSQEALNQKSIDLNGALQTNLEMLFSTPYNNTGAIRGDQSPNPFYASNTQLFSSNKTIRTNTVIELEKSYKAATEAIKKVDNDIIKLLEKYGSGATTGIRALEAMKTQYRDTVQKTVGLLDQIGDRNILDKASEEDFLPRFAKGFAALGADWESVRLRFTTDANALSEVMNGTMPIENLITTNMSLRNNLKNAATQFGIMKEAITNTQAEIATLNKVKDDFVAKQTASIEESKGALSYLLVSTIMRDKLADAIGDPFLANIILDCLFPGFTCVENYIVASIKSRAIGAKMLETTNSLFNKFLKCSTAIWALNGVYNAVEKAESFGYIGKVVSISGKVLTKTGDAITKFTTLKALKTGMKELKMKVCNEKEKKEDSMDTGETENIAVDQKVQNHLQMSLFCIGTCLKTIGGVLTTVGYIVEKITTAWTVISMISCAVAFIFSNMFAVLALAGGLIVTAMVVSTFVAFWPKSLFSNYMCLFSTLGRTVLTLGGGAMLAYSLVQTSGWMISLLKLAYTSGSWPAFVQELTKMKTTSKTSSKISNHFIL